MKVASLGGVAGQRTAPSTALGAQSFQGEVGVHGETSDAKTRGPVFRPRGACPFFKEQGQVAEGKMCQVQICAQHSARGGIGWVLDCQKEQPSPPACNQEAR